MFLVDISAPMGLTVTIPTVCTFTVPDTLSILDDTMYDLIVSTLNKNRITYVITGYTPPNYQTPDALQLSWEIDVIPISWSMDGVAAPGTLTTLSDTNKARYRDFSGSSDKDVFLEWEVPYGIDTTKGAFFQVEGFITNATGPVSGQTVKFGLRGTFLGSSDPLSQSMGPVITVAKTFESGFAQNDRFDSGWSRKISVSSLAAEKLSILNLKRDTTDTYSQAIGVGWLKIKYAKISQLS